MNSIAPGAEQTMHFTFDDGPDPAWTPRILSSLRREGVLATFFVVAPLARRYPNLIASILEEGHGVEFHCTEHIRHTERDHREIEEDTLTGLQTLDSLGVHPSLWRPPWGLVTPETHEVAGSFGLELALWDLDTHDWRGDSAAGMLENIGPGLVAGSVILMHDGLGPGVRRNGCAETGSLIGSLTERARSLGCEPTPLVASPSLRTERSKARA